jgi:hypothetical protein
MQKNGMLLIVTILICIGWLSGCTSPENNSEKSEEYTMEHLQLTLSDISSIYSSNGYEGKISINFAIPDVSTIHNCKMNRLTYVLYGNDQHVGGGTIDYIWHEGNKDFVFSETYSNVYFQQYLNVVSILPELRKAIENKTTVQWKVSGEFSVYTPDNSELMTLPFNDLTYYETFEEWK